MPSAVTSTAVGAGVGTAAGASGSDTVRGLMVQQARQAMGMGQEALESAAQVASFGIDEINQILHALDSPFITLMVPIKIPHPLDPEKAITITTKINLSILRVFGIIAIAYHVYKASPQNNDGKWNFHMFNHVAGLIDSLVTMAESFTDGLSDLSSMRMMSGDSGERSPAGTAERMGQVYEGTGSAAATAYQVGFERTFPMLAEWLRDNFVEKDK